MNNATTAAPQLPPGTVIDGTYTTGAVVRSRLGSVTYAATDLSGARVDITVYAPACFVSPVAMERSLRESGMMRPVRRQHSSVSAAMRRRRMARRWRSCLVDSSSLVLRACWSSSQSARLPLTKAPPPPLTPNPAPGAMPGIDQRQAERFRRGQIPIEGKIDLHGRTQVEEAAVEVARQAADGVLAPEVGPAQAAAGQAAVLAEEVAGLAGHRQRRAAGLKRRGRAARAEAAAI